MVCDYAIVTCQQCGGMCDHRNNMEGCPKAKLSINAHITFDECIKVYDEHGLGVDSRKKRVIAYVNKSLELVGLSKSSSTDKMSYRKFKELIAKLESEESGDGHRLAKSTISAVLSSFNAIVGVHLREYFEDLGYSRPVFDMPTYRVPKKKVKAMTLEQDCLVDTWMRQLSVSKDPIEQRMFVALWFERLFAVRPGDINRLTWDCIQIDGPVVRLVYRPNKTKHCPGRDDPIVVAPKLWSWVSPYYVKGGLLLPRLRSARKELSNNRAIWSRINKWYRDHDICDDTRFGKASYLNRRQRITEAFMKDGWRGAAAIGKNTPKVQLDSYISMGEYVA